MSDTRPEDKSLDGKCQSERSKASLFCEKYMLLRAWSLEGAFSPPDALNSAVAVWNLTCGMDAAEKEFCRTYVLSRAATVDCDFDALGALNDGIRVWAKMQRIDRPSAHINEYVDRHLRARIASGSSIDRNTAIRSACDVWRNLMKF